MSNYFSYLEKFMILAKIECLKWCLNNTYNSNKKDLLSTCTSYCDEYKNEIKKDNCYNLCYKIMSFKGNYIIQLFSY